MKEHISVIFMLMLSGFCLGSAVLMTMWNKVDGRGPWQHPIVCFVIAVIFGIAGILKCLAL